jgi:hypothetical protein
LTYINSLKLRKACRIDGIPNEYLRHLPRRPLVHLTHLFNHQKFPQNLCWISLLSTTIKLFKTVILQIVQKHIEERGLLNASQFGFHAHHSTTLQCMRLTENVTLNFNDNMPTAAVFLDIEKAFDTTWHSGILCK